MSLVNRTLVLTGAHSGRTIKLGGHSFTNGEFSFTLPEVDAEGLTKYFGRSYQAYVKGSIELAKAQKGSGDGEHNIQTDENEGKTDAVLGNDKSSGQGSSETKPIVGVETAKSGQGS